MDYPLAANNVRPRQCYRYGRGPCSPHRSLCPLI